VASAWDPEAALASVDGDHELLQMVIQAFLGESERLMNQIHQAISQHDLGELRRASHTLKGSTRIFGDTMANQVAQQIEDHARAGDDVDYVPMAAALESSLRPLVAGLKGYIKARGARLQ
jgi:HPt (histidine-containing phosphotransfer) domain-containing protein